MRCPHCGHGESRVIETREADDAVRRRRECESCRLRFTTYERPQYSRLVVRGAGGAQRSFTRSWLAGALAAAGVELPAAALRRIAAGIEAQLRATGRRVVTTGDVAALAARAASQGPAFGAPAPGVLTAEQVGAILDASLGVGRRPPAQLPLPLRD